MLTLLEAATQDKVVVVQDRRATVDIESHSVFTRERGAFQRMRQHLAGYRHRDNFRDRRLSNDYGIGEQGPATRHIWYTGENLRPPVGWDLTLSFDTDRLDGANHYLPHWAIRTGVLSGPDQRDLMSVGEQTYREGRNNPRIPPKFACVLASNPHPMRDQIAEALGEVGHVERFGRAYGKPVQSKNELLKQYRYCITPENDLYPGYVTEKPFEAWLTGTVPIWWGLDPNGHLDQGALLNVATEGLAGTAEAVANMETSADIWARMVSRSLLKRSYDYEALITFVASRIC